VLAHRSHQDLGQVDHQHRQVGTVVDRRWLDHHEVFQAPVLFGVSEVELDLEAQAIVIDERFVA
jgi:hypothetical protein